MTIDEIERAVERLEGEDYFRFHEWFMHFSETKFDKAIEKDVGSGRLNKWLDDVLADDIAGRTKPL